MNQLPIPPHFASIPGKGSDSYSLDRYYHIGAQAIRVRVGMSTEPYDRYAIAQILTRNRTWQDLLDEGTETWAHDLPASELILTHEHAERALEPVASRLAALAGAILSPEKEVAADTDLEGWRRNSLDLGRLMYSAEKVVKAYHDPAALPPPGESLDHRIAGLRDLLDDIETRAPKSSLVAFVRSIVSLDCADMTNVRAQTSLNNIIDRARAALKEWE